jgi:SAM-dependent methyltransferase
MGFCAYWISSGPHDRTLRHIGLDYAALRRPDPRIAKAIHAHLEGAVSVLNVGAGAGSYEPAHLKVTAAEPSSEMIRQRPQSDTAVVQAAAEALPFADKSFDASMAILTVHHWSDVPKGLREMRRVTRGKIVILTFDPVLTDFWLLDYLPDLGTLDLRQTPRMADRSRSRSASAHRRSDPVRLQRRGALRLLASSRRLPRPEGSPFDIVVLENRGRDRALAPLGEGSA